MKTGIILSFVLFIGLLSSCQKEPVAPAPANAPACTTAEAQSRLMACSRWVIDEAISGDQSVYKRGLGSLNATTLTWSGAGLVQMAF